MKNLNLDFAKSIELLLEEKYFNEFEIIDGQNRHPKFINFYEWLYTKKLITKEELTEIQKEIELEDE
ncbi:hypothetical protein ACTS93_15455 [Empedobacter falsenii]